MTLKPAYLVADIGTGNVRVAIADTSGTILGVASGDQAAHGVADHHHRKVTAGVGHDGVEVVDDRLEVLHQRGLAV